MAASSWQGAFKIAHSLTSGSDTGTVALDVRPGRVRMDIDALGSENILITRDGRREWVWSVHS